VETFGIVGLQTNALRSRTCLNHEISASVESDPFRPFYLHDSGVMHNNLHHFEPDRTDMLFHNPEPIDRLCSGFARLRFVGRYHVSSRPQ
jgi:hypothetical protein